MKIKLTLIALLVYLIGFSQSGEIDTSFGTNGKVITGFGSNNNTANAVAFQPDGKFIVGGGYISNRGDFDFALARYNSNGSLDTSFGEEGKVVTDFGTSNNYSHVHSVYVLPDGKIMALGSSGVESLIPRLVIVRYNANGTIDAGFGSNGKIVSQFFSMSHQGNKLVFLPDGKFLVTSVKRYSTDTTYYFGVERYTADGLLDTDFGTNGETVTSFGTGMNIPSAITLQSDGKILVTGRYQATNLPQMAVARFNANGTLDTTFDGDGKVVTTFGTGIIGEAFHISVNPDNKIAVAGILYSPVRSLGLLRYNPNGSLDTSFDGDGKVITIFADGYDNISSITKQADGKFLIVIRSDNYALTASDLVVRRFNATGVLDTTFGNNGQISTTFNTGTNEAQAAGISPDGKIVLVGKSIPLGNATTDFAIARYNADGAIDVSLDNDGKVTTSFEKGNDQVTHLLVQPDDKLITIGTSAHRQSNGDTFKNIILSKYNSDGSLDTSFGNSGKMVSVFGQNKNYTSAAVLQNDGKIVVGNMYYNTTIDNFYHHEIIRYNANGSVDSSFGTNGKAVVNFEISSLKIQSDGKIIVGGTGTANTPNAGVNITRFNADGTIDNSFDNDGTTIIALGNVYYGKLSVLLQSDGKIVVTGSASHPDLFNDAPAFVASRINSNGTLDTTFGTNGKAAILINDNCFAYSGFIQPDGKILITGMSFGGGVIYFSSSRFTAEGTIDTTYGNNGAASDSLAYDYRIINDILLQADGKFLVALSQYNFPLNTYDFKIRRFNPDGTFDNEFGGFAGINTSFFSGYDEVFSLGLQSDNKIIAAGNTFNGVTNDFAMTRYTNTVLNITDFTIDTDVMLYPNPTTGILNIKTSDSIEYEIQEFSVYNMLGQMVYNNSDDKTIIDTRSFPNGIYNLQIKTSKGLINKKFIRE